MSEEESETVLLSTGARVTVARKRPQEAEPPVPVIDPKRPAIERVNNVWGSTAGAGSDFFHIYRKHRAVEIDRLKKLDEEYQRDQEERAFQQRREALIRQNELRTEKRAAKRKQRKQRLQEKKVLKKEAEALNAFRSDGSFLAQVQAGPSEDAEKTNNAPKPTNLET